MFHALQKYFALAAIVLIAEMPRIVSGQSPMDEYQARLLFHSQRVQKSDHIGLAFWLVFPNIRKTSPLRILTLGGIVLHEKDRWLELMAGAIINRPGIVEPELDTRMAEKSLKWVEFYSELAYNFQTKEFYANMIPMFPISATGIKVGADADLFLTHSMTIYNVGPRATLQLPFFENVIVSSAYKFQNDGTKILRFYLLINV